MQTNILDWLEATSARCPDAPAVGDDQTDCTWAQLADTARRAGSFLASRTMPRRPVAFYLENPFPPLLPCLAQSTRAAATRCLTPASPLPALCRYWIL